VIGDPAYEIHPATYHWSVRVFRLLRRLVRVNIELHADAGRLRDGDIFLFNHFARFETFIPQYLIYEQTGALCRSIAAGEFFIEGDPFSAYLRRVGAVPNSHPGLLPFLALELLRGRKVVVFPEGGMVKDRRVVDPGGGYRIYSRSADMRRGHHTGAAVLALTLDAVKGAVLAAAAAGHARRVEAWAEVAGLAGAEALLAAARRPTRVVPANITFYPIRVSDNLLRRGAELLGRGLSRRLSEELLIEGNILLRDTDMDIRLGPALVASQVWGWWERPLIARVFARLGNLGEAFALHPERGAWDQRAAARRLRRQARRVRDETMRRMYLAVTVNLSHLAARLMLALLEGGEEEVGRRRFEVMLYRLVKAVQAASDLHLHRSLRDPGAYADLPDGRCPGLAQLLVTAGAAGLVETADDRLRFRSKLREEHDFDEIRLANPVEVYANEAAPLRGVSRAVAQVLREGGRLAPRELAALRFDDELLAHAWDRAAFHRPRHQAVNEAETATEDGAPFLLLPGKPRSVGVLLVHGFLASPAELRGLGERLHARGHAVHGVRLKGHGTSPWDLRERTRGDWLASVERGLAILAPHVERVAVVGFSTGGALALLQAARRPQSVCGVVAASVPYRFRDARKMRFVLPMVHGANRFVRWARAGEGLMPFRINESEHPRINYRHMPVRGLWELQQLVGELDAALPLVLCPVALLQGSHDPVVDPSGVDHLAQRLPPGVASLTIVPAHRHGILNEDLGGAQDRVVDFLEGLEHPAPGQTRPQALVPG
jgi:esterase/lipase